jgi:SAM-dependent methyltransferase
MNILKKTVKYILKRYNYPPVSEKTVKGKTTQNQYLQSSAWDYQKIWLDKYLPTEGIIVDVGSGNYPVPRADILADYFPDESIHRSGSVCEDRPLVICSLERMPFLNKSVDFLICSHVFEHLEHPEKAASETGRVAKAGYIETPTYGKDILIGTGYIHNWQVVEFEGTLHFFEYSQRQKEAHTTSPVMHIWMQPHYHPWQDFFWERQDLFNAVHIWEEAPKLITHRRTPSQTKLLPSWNPVQERFLKQEAPQLSDREIGLLESCLATPDGKESMRYEENKFVNREGNIIYPVCGKRIYCEIAYQNI